MFKSIGTMDYIRRCNTYKRFRTLQDIIIPLGNTIDIGGLCYTFNQIQDDYTFYFEAMNILTIIVHIQILLITAIEQWEVEGGIQCIDWDGMKSMPNIFQQNIWE